MLPCRSLHTVSPFDIGVKRPPTHRDQESHEDRRVSRKESASLTLFFSSRHPPLIVQKDASCVDLSGRLLPHYPTEVDRLTHLTVLRLNHCTLNSINRSICRLAALKELELQGNRLRTVPNTMGALSSLETINLDDNMLSHFPNVLGRLSQLKKISCNQNRIERFSASLYLRACEHLELRSNHLLELPKKWDWAPQLKSIDLNDNHIEQVFFNRVVRVSIRCDLRANPLNQESVAHLRAYHYPNITYETTSHLFHLFKRWYYIGQQSDSVMQTHAMLQELSKQSTATLENFFERLRSIRSFAKDPNNTNYPVRVLRVIAVMCRDREARDEIVHLMNAALGECQDRISLYFSEIETLCIAKEYLNEHSTLEDCARLVRRVYNLDRLDYHLRIHIRSYSRPIDEVEIFLRARIFLRNILDLPVNVTTMRFSALISEDELSRIATKIQSEYRTKEQFKEILLASALWKKQLESHEEWKQTMAQFYTWYAECGLDPTEQAEKERGIEEVNRSIHDYNAWIHDESLALQPFSETIQLERFMQNTRLFQEAQKKALTVFLVRFTEDWVYKNHPCE